MKTPGLPALRARHDAAWRDPVQVASQWAGAEPVDERLLRCTVRGRFWETLAEHGLTLLVTREYEHLLIALSPGRSRPMVSYLPLPHPNGLAVDARRGVVYVASTRNPNQIFDLMPVGAVTTAGNGPKPLPGHLLVPVRSRFLPGALYLHDLAMVGGVLHGNAVGQNAVVRLHPDGRYERVWWPRCVETRDGPLFARNHLQLNSIAAGPTLEGSYFSASTDAPSVRRPGHRNFAVDGRGVIFSGTTRETVVRGLTRPHSARLHDGRLWVDNSGYGEVGVVENDRVVAVARLPGWTRGLGFHRHLAFVGTSQILARFHHYAPGLDPARCVCGVHVLDTRSGRVIGSLAWEAGNQIFAVEPVPRRFATGLPLLAGRRTARREIELFSRFVTLAGKDAR
jgi:uncharacterized protein (TIGR03032 family)